ncbi:MAG TPA: hypothetical protein VM889_13005 [Candidatus Thermoplasmatota archaeon]|nr:hypothetical protein [Candidatus Thermoplasmatota archaeon]
MDARRALLALALVGLVPGLSGCIGDDLINGYGTIRFYLTVTGPEDSDVERFQFVQVVLTQAAAKPADSTPIHNFEFNATGIDLVDLSKGGRFFLGEYHGKPRAFNRVSVSFLCPSASCLQRAAWDNGTRAEILMAPNGFYFNPAVVKMEPLRLVEYELQLKIMESRGAYIIATDAANSGVKKTEFGPIF